LAELGRLGHFLKGSSAAIGVIKVRDLCEKMQHWGHSKDETGSKPIKDEDALKYIEDALIQAREGFDEAEVALRKVSCEYRHI
jgi:osomolarity two-component system phosphorelay intermediate protein YPD1